MNIRCHIVPKTLPIFRFGLLKTQVFADSSKAEELLVKCTGKIMYQWSFTPIPRIPANFYKDIQTKYT